MTGSESAEMNRLFELLADRATQGLESDQSDELSALLRESREVDSECMDRAAAAVELCLLDPSEVEPMPAAVRRRIEHRLSELPDNGAAEQPPSPIAGRIGPIGAFGWLAAAACLVLAVLAWMSPATNSEPSFAEVAAAPDAVRASWSAGPHPAGENASGEVVWSDSRQAGYMTFRNLPANDPSERQYQLWIFDPDKDQHPVDGGVFDIPSGADEVRVPINAKLPVDDPSMFAVTIEKPGGVVVSDQERLPVLAKIEKG